MKPLKTRTSSSTDSPAPFGKLPCPASARLCAALRRSSAEPVKPAGEPDGPSASELEGLDSMPKCAPKPCGCQKASPLLKHHHDLYPGRSGSSKERHLPSASGHRDLASPAPCCFIPNAQPRPFSSARRSRRTGLRGFCAAHLRPPSRQ